MKITLLTITLLLPLLFLAQPKPIATSNLGLHNIVATTEEVDSPSFFISEEGYVMINGIEQWITVKGNKAKPAILFIHGGPGSAITPYNDIMFKDLQKDFVIVQWDQRGTARTYGKNNPAVALNAAYLQANPLTLEQMTQDGVNVAKFILQHLGKEKLILTGTSWGSALAVKIASSSPTLFYAYVGHSQIVNHTVDKKLFKNIYWLAELHKDNQSLEILNRIGQPPYSSAKNMGLLFKIVKKYERLKATPAPDNWFVLAPEYDNAFDDKNREDGDDYSFVNYVGDTKLGVKPMMKNINLFKDNLNFKIPVYFIQGEEDLTTPKETSKKYFDLLQAPSKQYYLIPNAAHGFNEAIITIQSKIFRSIKCEN